jgi:ribosomal protein L37AE/L43A
MIAPNGSQKKLQTITLWRYCHGCSRSTPMRKIAGDTIWQCPWCGYHDPEAAVQTSAKKPEAGHGQ